MLYQAELSGDNDKKLAGKDSNFASGCEFRNKSQS